MDQSLQRGGGVGLSFAQAPKTAHPVTQVHNDPAVVLVFLPAGADDLVHRHGPPLVISAGCA
jgi:hypothetical protein